MQQIRSCCGIGEIEGLSNTPQETVMEVWNGAQALGGEKYKIVVFTDRVAYGYGVKLAKYILKNKLGKIYSSPAVINPVHHSKVKLWAWHVDWRELKKWRKTKDAQELAGNIYD